MPIDTLPIDTVLIDYGAGNLHSVHKALLHSGLPVEITADPGRAAEATVLVLPGQGHFGQVMNSFLESGFEPVVRRHLAQQRPFLGICVGLQLLLEGSEEAPDVPGLGMLRGTVRRFPTGMRVPQMGWNRLYKHGDSPLLAGLEDGAYAYFANSYYAHFEADLAGAQTTYGDVRFLSALSAGSLHATQFHPEKSQRVGLHILSNFRATVTEAVSGAA
ncbi:MAG: imidazole glycerol phosphate synthase subunit HisH [Trueperaceae bacterium]